MKLIAPGTRFGRLTVIEFERMTETQPRRSAFRCRCDCGNVCIVLGRHLKAGIKGTRSCGCLLSETAAKICKVRGPSQKTHGMSRTRTYHIWRAMLARCYNPKHIHYRFYGGRGITVCNGWRAGFVYFYADMGRCPSNAHSIERIDNTHGYTRSNCVWATAKQQAQNRSNNIYLTYKDQRLTVGDWAFRLQIYPSTIHRRIKKNLPIEEILRH